MESSKTKFVYKHFLYGKCFYIGMGVKQRPFQYKKTGNFSRSKKWWDFVGDNLEDVQVEIVGEYSLEKAKKIEKELIIYHYSKGDPLTNTMIGQGLPGKLNGMFNKGHKIKGKNNGMFNKLSANHKEIIVKNLTTKEEKHFISIQECYDHYDGIIGSRSIFKNLSGIKVPKIEKMNLTFKYKENKL